MAPERRRFLKLCAAGAGALLAGCSTANLPDPGESDGEDDWQYTPPEAEEDGVRAVAAGGDGGDAAAAQESIGLAAGGAADVGTFRRNVYEDYLPIPESMATEGLYYEYYFDTGGDGSCESLFCPTYTPAVSPDPFSEEPEQYLTVGLDSGLSQDEFERPALNLVIVLDVSGSMSASFDEYYYDQHGNRQRAEGDTSKPKIDVAKEALVALTEHLRPEDRLGVVLFNDQSHLAKPLNPVEETDMDAIREHIREDVRAGGGTNVSAGLAQSEELMAEYADADAEEYENRSILITDAQINMGETDADELESGLADNADSGHHTTVIGVGVDFNAELVDRITSVKGANYYSVHSTDEFHRRMDEEFEYVVTPLVFDLSLELDTEGYDIARVYGTPDDDDSAEIMTVDTLFPSPRTDGRAKGGVVLVQVERTGNGADGGELELSASWETRAGDEESVTETVTLPDADETYGNTAVRKAVLLARYADLMTNWTVYEREETLVEAEGELDHPPDEDELGRWEQQSEPLTVSETYAQRIGTFRGHFAAEADAIGDDDLSQELELMDYLLEAA